MLWYVWLLFLKLFLRTVYENIEYVIKMLSENSLLFKFNVFFMFF